MIRRLPLRKKSRRRQRADRAQRVPYGLWFGSVPDACWVCLELGISVCRKVEKHHLCVGRRVDCPENWLLLGDVHHRQFHVGGELHNGERLPELTPGNLLWLKEKYDPENYDPAVICRLKGWQSLPDHWLPRCLNAQWI